MNTPTENTEPRTRRPSFWLRAIEQRKHELGRDYRKSLGSVAREGISDEDYATTMATLEKMATNLGWDESQRPERGFGRGFGPGDRHFGHRGRGFGPRGMRHHGHGHDHEGHNHHDHETDLPGTTPEA